MKTGSAEMLALAAVAGLLPQALLGPLTGVFIDRWSRKLVMILSDSFIAFCTLILAVLFWLDIAEMWHIFLLLALRSVGSAFHMPAMQASVPLLAPQDQLTRVAGIDQVIQSVCNIAGPALGAFFITFWKMEYVLMLDVVGAILACVSLLFVRIPNPRQVGEKVKNVLYEMREGAMSVLRNRGLSFIFLYSTLVTFFIMPISVLFPLMTLKYFGGNAFQVSLIEIVWGVGALLGGLVMGAITYKKSRVTLVNWMYLVVGLTFFLSGILPPTGFVLFAIITTLAGVSGAVYNAAFTAILQTYIDPATLGRVFSMFITLSLIPSLLGLIGIGFFADRLGITTSFVVCGVAILVVGLLAFITPSAMRLDKKIPNFAD